jgi:hypothetical protein
MSDAKRRELDALSERDLKKRVEKMFNSWTTLKADEKKSAIAKLCRQPRIEIIDYLVKFER